MNERAAGRQARQRKRGAVNEMGKGVVGREGEWGMRGRGKEEAASRAKNK